jgi:hydroxypyruvate reductase
LSDAIEGESRRCRKSLCRYARGRAARSTVQPAILLLGRRDDRHRSRQGQGRPQRRILLAFALAIEGVAGITALAADTDGTMAEDNAGASPMAPPPHATGAAGVALPRRSSPTTTPSHRLQRHRWRPPRHRPHGTNVNDFRAILIR